MPDGPIGGSLVIDVAVVHDEAGYRVPGSVAYFVLLGIVWVLLAQIHSRLPYIRPGANLVHEAKTERLARQDLFSPTATVRVVALGNSRTMAGFKPDVFDHEVGRPGVQSVNLGLPGDNEFLPVLEALLKAGNRPTHVLIQVGWLGEPQSPTWLDDLRADAKTLDRIAPFHDLPRDAVTFALLSHGDLKGKYQSNFDDVEGMISARGWYFIKSQSLRPDGRLPVGYRLPTDAPTQVNRRPVSTEAWRYRRLMELSRQYGFTPILIPEPDRQGEFAPAQAINPPPGVRAVGSDYLLVSPTKFSDPIHLNPEGAREYTTQLAHLLKGSL